MIWQPYLKLCLTLAASLAAEAVYAASLEAIPQGYRRVASEYGLPPALLCAAALTASGRVLGGKHVRPWPWTLTSDRRRRHYPTRLAAYRALTATLARGCLDVRVGVMGLPWHRYAVALGGPWAALDPYTNLWIAVARLAPHLAGRSVPSARGRPGALDKLTAALAPRYALDPRLVREVVALESAYNPRARSPKGAQGLMQLMPPTALRFGVEDPLKPEDNLMGGMRYLAHLLTYYRGDLTRVLAAYNAGEDAVDRYGGVPPYAETRTYVSHILQRYGKLTHPYRRELALNGNRAEERS